MWLATDNLHQEEVDVIINENGDALCYYNRRLNSYNNIEPSIHLFESKDLAEKWLTDYKETLREKMSECRRFVDLMMNIQPSEDFDFKVKVKPKDEFKDLREFSEMLKAQSDD